MGFDKQIDKLNDYFARLDAGKVEKIKTDHVEKVIHKLQAKKAELEEELAEAESERKKDRITNKIGTATEQIERAEWLLGQIAGRCPGIYHSVLQLDAFAAGRARCRQNDMKTGGPSVRPFSFYCNREAVRPARRGSA